jgi:hypothetical protein
LQEPLFLIESPWKAFLSAISNHRDTDISQPCRSPVKNAAPFFYYEFMVVVTRIFPGMGIFRWNAEAPRGCIQPAAGFIGASNKI